MRAKTSFLISSQILNTARQILNSVYLRCSEEYEPDARLNREATSLDGPEATSMAKIDIEGYDRMVQFVRYFGLYYGSFTLQDAQKVFKCAPPVCTLQNTAPFDHANMLAPQHAEP